MLSAFFISLAVVALSEMGDKTQLLALLLAAKFRKPLPILAAIFLATVVNHGVSAVLGQWITTVLSGVFGATFVLFFLAEIGDKTQIATVALAARFDSIGWVTLGTTLGIMLVNAPAVFIGNKLAEKLPISLIHKIGALVFLVIGVAALAQHYLF